MMFDAITFGLLGLFFIAKVSGAQTENKDIAAECCGTGPIQSGCIDFIPSAAMKKKLCGTLNCFHVSLIVAFLKDLIMA
jgi:hypothetical protein